MRSTLLLLISSLIFGCILWVTLSGASFFFGIILWTLWLIVSIVYADRAVLFFLGAREIKTSDEVDFAGAASQEAYKLALPKPKLYFYNGTLERGYILQNRKNISLVLCKELLKSATPEELSAICFELLLQAKKGMAGKRTKLMFLLGIQSWIAHTFVSLISKLIPVKEINQVLGVVLNFLLHPWLNFLFKLCLGGRYFKRLESHLDQFKQEKESLRRVGLKLKKTTQLYSLPSRKMMELSSVLKSRHYQSILALEFLPHEWDHMFNHREELTSVGKV